MTIEKRREWSNAEIMTVMREIAAMPQPERQSADFYTVRLLLDARADLAEAREQIVREREVLIDTQIHNIARARLEGAIEALTWAYDEADDEVFGRAHIDLRIAELCIELEKLNHGNR